jgi:hypothetical protein
MERIHPMRRYAVSNWNRPTEKVVLLHLSPKQLISMVPEPINSEKEGVGSDEATLWAAYLER